LVRCAKEVSAAGNSLTPVCKSTVLLRLAFVFTASRAVGGDTVKLAGGLAGSHLAALALFLIDGPRRN
jgi:hypothetical protein